MKIFVCKLCGYKVADEAYFYEHKFRCSKKQRQMIKVGYGQRLEGQLDKFSCLHCGLSCVNPDLIEAHEPCIALKHTKTQPKTSSGDANLVKVTFGAIQQQDILGT